MYKTERNIYKNTCGNKLIFEEKNLDLGLSLGSVVHDRLTPEVGVPDEGCQALLRPDRHAKPVHVVLPAAQLQRHALGDLLVDDRRTGDLPGHDRGTQRIERPQPQGGRLTAFDGGGRSPEARGEGLDLREQLLVVARLPQQVERGTAGTPTRPWRSGPRSARSSTPFCAFSGRPAMVVVSSVSSTGVVRPASTNGSSTAPTDPWQVAMRPWANGAPRAGRRG